MATLGVKSKCSVCQSYLKPESEAIEEEGEKISVELLTLADIVAPTKFNDPLNLTRKHIRTRTYNSNVCMHYPDKFPDKVCLDLSHTNFNFVSNEIISRSSCICYVNLSYSKIFSLPSSFYDHKIVSLILRGCQSNLIYKIKKFIKSKREGFSIVSFLKTLDISYVEQLELYDVNSLLMLFPILERAFLRGCHLKEIPFDIEGKRVTLRFLDLSHNNIERFSPNFWEKVTFGKFNLSDPTTYPQGEARQMSLQEGLDAHLVEVEGKTHAVLACPNRDGPSFIHIDLRENPLNADTYAIFCLFNSVRISSKHQVVILPGNTFIYTNLPSPIGLERDFSALHV